MKTLLIEGGDYTGIVVLILAIALSPAIIMMLIGFAIKKTKPKASKILFIIAVVYTIISLGVCGSMIS